MRGLEVGVLRMQGFQLAAELFNLALQEGVLGLEVWGWGSLDGSEDA